MTTLRGDADRRWRGAMDCGASAPVSFQPRLATNAKACLRPRVQARIAYGLCAVLAQTVAVVGKLAQRVLDNAQLRGRVLGRLVDQLVQRAVAGVVGRRRLRLVRRR